MTPGEADVEVVVLTAEEAAPLVRKVLDDAGVTADELRAQALAGNFDSEDARIAWFTVGDFLDLV